MGTVPQGLPQLTLSLPGAAVLGQLWLRLRVRQELLELIMLIKINVKGLLQNQERHDRLQLLEFLVRQILIKLHLIQVEEVLTPTEVLDLVS